MKSSYFNRPARPDAFKPLFQKLAKTDSRKLDDALHQAHESVFAKTDCLSCGNCCRTTGPLLIDKDVERLARHFKLKPAEFESRYLRTDEDGDLVFKAMPCPFLGEDNFCSVYENRPKACREYPHTDRRKQHQILKLTEENAHICPAVYDILLKIDSLLANKGL